METDWTRFRVNAKWFDDLVARNKISRDQWVAYTLQKEPLALRHASHSKTQRRFAGHLRKAQSYSGGCCNAQGPNRLKQIATLAFWFSMVFAMFPEPNLEMCHEAAELTRRLSRAYRRGCRAHSTCRRLSRAYRRGCRADSI